MKKFKDFYRDRTGRDNPRVPGEHFDTSILLLLVCFTDYVDEVLVPELEKNNAKPDQS